MKSAFFVLAIATIGILITATRPRLSANPTNVAEIESYINRLVINRSIIP